MFLGVTWAVTAAVVGFMLGRMSMYGQWEPEEVGVEAERAEIERTEIERAEIERARAAERAEVERAEVKRARVAERNEIERAKGEGGEAERIEVERFDAEKAKARHGRLGWHKRGNKTMEEWKAWSVGSPVSGEVMASGEGGYATVVIRPREDRLYAPASGKVTRLFPMGNALVFTTEFGAELRIQAGDAGDELLSRYYRPRILQNEVVGKGKLLLEFDRQGLEAEGASSEVSVCVENCCYGGDVRPTAAQWVRTGEEILQVRKSGSPSKY